jgi:hypothetical protein
MNRLFAAALVALSVGFATAPAFAMTREVGLEQIKTIYTLAKWSTENSTPEFSCYDMTDNTTCQTIRSANVEDGTVLFITLADKTTVGCFKRYGAKYRMCSNNAGLKPEILQGHWVSVPVDDKRCLSFGDQFDEDYLACEAALRPGANFKRPAGRFSFGDS